MNAEDNESRQDLRRQAEKLARGNAPPLPVSVDDLSQEEIRQALHELQVHQIELDMQNEELRRAQTELEAARASYFDLYDLAPVGYVTLSGAGLILEMNLTAATQVGVARGALIKQRFSSLIFSEDQDIFFRHRKLLLETGAPQVYELRLTKKDAAPFWVRINSTMAKDTNGTPVCRATMSDITDRKKMDAVRDFLAKYSGPAQDKGFFALLAQYLAVTLSMDFICIDRLEGDGLIARTVAVWCDGKFEDNVSYALKDTPCGEVVGKAVCCFPANVCQFFPRDQVLQDLRADSYVGVTLWNHTGKPIGLIAVIGRHPLANRPLAEDILQLVAVRAAGEMERLDAEEAKARMEARLQQAQKMEVVGRLAGGVAHDFNNMLGVVLGHAEIALERLAPSDQLHSDLTEIHKAASRSADITRQLLAFARKQTIAPIVMDLNDTVTGMLKMLQRLIGENIDLQWHPGMGLWPVKTDPSQIDQILANLCINVRDAIAGPGKVIIETSKAAFDEAYCADHAGFVPGEYVRLAVSDNGCGMDKEAQSHLFEPFFTTKELGKGTGLGLATVYGIVKQNAGFINVYSETNQGTTLTIYFPRHIGKAEQARTEDPPKPAVRGQETILLAEDEPAVLDLTKSLLERQGYTVLAASTPGEAIRLANEYAGEIHLLMTDVVMPEMNGRDLAKTLLTLYPRLKRLFTSGYTADIIAHNGVLDEGVHFIQKPFSIKALAAKVREVLDQKQELNK
jgi:PAS domain S-box-containing protein